MRLRKKPLYRFGFLHVHKKEGFDSVIGPNKYVIANRSRSGARPVIYSSIPTHNIKSFRQNPGDKRLVEPRAISDLNRQTTQQTKTWIIWVGTFGIFLPNTIGVTGKYIVAPLSLLAVIRFLVAISNGSRRILACDLFVLATVLWMIGAEISVTGTLSLTTGSDALGFVGAFIVARAFIFGVQPLRTFIRALKFVAIALIAFSALDTLTGHFFINDAVATLFHDTPLLITKGTGDIHRELLGITVIRATSTFNHPILYGSFCAFAAAIFLYSEHRMFSRALYVGVCLLGCVLSISSAPLLAFMIIVSVYCYDQFFSRSPSRWKLFWMAVFSFIFTLCLLSDRPLGFFFDHFTFTPQTGYYRVLIWQNALNYIAISPFTGDGSIWQADEILGDSVDSVWLVLSLLYGLPVSFFLLLATLAACVGIRPTGKRTSLSFGMQRLGTAFSVVITVFVFLGLTVHFWASIWLFWGLCLGIRASIKEYASAEVRTMVRI